METAPKDGTCVLLWNRDEVAVGHWTGGDIHGRWWDENEEYTFNHVTHWMPLPEPPDA